MLVRIADSVNIQKARRNERPRARAARRRTFPQQFDLDATFFPGLSQRGLFRVFIQFHMSTEGQPLVQLPMMNQQNPMVLNDKNADCKINLFVNMRHAQMLIKSAAVWILDSKPAENQNLTCVPFVCTLLAWQLR
jgi:hypothetical protein